MAFNGIASPGAKAEGDLLRRFRREVAHLLGREQVTFPGAQPVSFARKHLEELKREDYYVCEKSDGLRYLMYCTSDENNNEVVYLIDRRNDFFHIKELHFPIPNDHTYQGFHQGTLIDGELVMDRDSHHQISAKYLVFDCLFLDGNSLMHRTLDKRLAYFKERVFEPYKALYKAFPQEIQYLPFVVELKQMQFAYGTEMMFKEILPKLPHGNDGLIFTCRNSPYQHGTDPHILKWKPENENSVDFHLSLDFPVVDPSAPTTCEGTDYDSIPVCNLSVGGAGDTTQWYGSLYLEEQEWETMKAEGAPLNDRIVECYMDVQRRWRFMRWRDDKDKPNYITTVDSVIESIKDRVTEKDLIVEAKVIRAAWKAREAKAGHQQRADSERQTKVESETSHG